jgi:hypothetical protein
MKRARSLSFLSFSLSLLVFPPGCSGAPESPPAQPAEPSEEKILACGSSALRMSSHGACEAMDAVAIPDPDYGSCACLLGYAWNGSACVMLGDCSCKGNDCDKLTMDKGECEAAHAQCGNTPSVPHLSCSDSRLRTAHHDACPPMDAKATPDPEYGGCLCFLGYAWNGSSCVGLADCFCEGADCDKLTMDKAECEVAHAQCR